MYTVTGRGKKSEVVLTGILGVCIILSLALPAYAHRIRVFAYAEGNRVFVEAAYGGGENASGARVDVTDESGTTVGQGFIDGEGGFSFTAKSPGEYRVAVTDGKGHSGSFVLEKGAFHVHQGDTGQKVSPAVHDSHHESGMKDAESKVGGPSGQKGFEAILDRKMGPIRQELKEIRRIVDRPLYREVVGGVGYIVGLLGLVFFFFGRKTGGGK